MTSGYPYGGKGIFHNFLGIDFSIVHATNTGAAWGAFSNFPEFLLYFRIIAIVGVLFYLLFFNKIVKQRLPLALIAAGACGNVIDHFVYGHVVDMFYFTFSGHSYPVFNIADSAIFSGVVLLLFQSSIKKKSSATA